METFEDAISDDRFVLVDFFATWCQPCQMMHPVLEQVKAVLGDKLRIMFIRYDKNILNIDDFTKTFVRLLQQSPARTKPIKELFGQLLPAYRPQTTTNATGQNHAVIQLF